MKRILKTGLAGALISASLSTMMLASAPLHAEGFGPMNMMNPSRWFGNNRDDAEDYYGPNGGYPPPGAAPYGAPGYPPPGYGAPYGGTSVYTQPQAAYHAPSTPQAGAGSAPSAGPNEEGTDERIRRLEERINQLEAENARMRGAGMGHPQGPQHAQGRPMPPTPPQDGGYPDGMMETAPQNHVWRPQQ